jgi:hypothetical protein
VEICCECGDVPFRFLRHGVSLLNDMYSVSLSIWSRMKGRQINYELEGMWMEAWPNSRYYPGTCFEGLTKTTKNVSGDSRSPGRDLKPEPPKNETMVLTIRPRRSIDFIDNGEFGAEVLSKGFNGIT